MITYGHFYAKPKADIFLFPLKTGIFTQLFVKLFSFRSPDVEIASCIVLAAPLLGCFARR